MDKKEKMRRVLKFLRKRYGDELYYGEPFEVLISTIISQRNTGESTKKVSRELFRVARTPQGIARIPMKRLQKIIMPSGTWKQKSKRIHDTAKIIRKRGGVPKDRGKLMELPGVGPKTADIVLMYGFGVPSIAVDTHCNRVPRRLGLVGWDATISDVKKELERITPKSQWYMVNQGFVSFGREVCRPVNPRCTECPFLRFCPFGKERVKYLRKK
ncbi:MAG: endonuclease III domain-containing protein [Candidatus Aenigmatarchaeota archaeon]